MGGITNKKVTESLGNGDGTFQYSPQLVTPGPAGVTAIASGDTNGDAVPDVAIGAGKNPILSALSARKRGRHHCLTDGIVHTERCPPAW